MNLSRLLLLSLVLPVSAADVVYLSPSANLARDWAEATGKMPGSIVFRPGDYTVRTELALPFGMSNSVISGYGAKLWLTGVNLTGQYHVLRSHWEGNSGITWEGFTIDCGKRATWGGPGKSCGIAQIGSGTVRNCTVRNLVSNGGDESFGIILKGTNGTCSGNLVSGVFSNGLVTGISLQGESVSATANSVDLEDTSATNGVTTFGYTLYGSYSVLSANTARRCDAGLSMDGAGSQEATVWRDNTISACQFSGNVMCVRVDSNFQPYRGWNFSGNVFHADGGAWLSIGTNGAEWRSNRVDGFTFIGNQFSGTPSAVNLHLWNYGQPHSFIANTFSAPPMLNTGTNRNTIFGSGNMVQGEPSDRAFGTDRTEWDAR